MVSSLLYLHQPQTDHTAMIIVMEALVSMMIGGDGGVRDVCKTGWRAVDGIPSAHAKNRST